MKVYEANVFDYATKGRCIVAVAARNRADAVLAFNGHEIGGRGYTDRINIIKDASHPAFAIGEGMVIVFGAGGWEPLRSGPLAFPGGPEAEAAVAPIAADLGFVPVSPNVYARAPERRWWRPDDGTLIIIFSPMSSLTQRLAVTGAGMYLGCPWGEWDRIPALVGQIEAHRARIMAMMTEVQS